MKQVATFDPSGASRQLPFRSPQCGFVWIILAAVHAILHGERLMTEPCKNLAKPLQNLFQGGTMGASPGATSPLESSFTRFHLYRGGRQSVQNRALCPISGTFQRRYKPLCADFSVERLRYTAYHGPMPSFQFPVSSIARAVKAKASGAANRGGAGPSRRPPAGLAPPGCSAGPLGP